MAIAFHPVPTPQRFARRFAAVLAPVLLWGSVATSQTVEYTITYVPLVPGAFNTVPVAMNDQGVVVGWAQFSGGEFFLRGWRWSADEGLTLLPPPPGSMSDRYGAQDINNSGVIAGDGGYDSGQAWRFENGTYTIVGALPGLAANRRPAINSTGNLVATAFNPGSFLVPTRALLFEDGFGTVELFPEYGSSRVGDVNDAGQIAATNTAGPVRVESDGALTFLPTPQGFAGFTPARINAAGDIAGIAGCTHECNQAFLWTEQTGLQAIPTVGTRQVVEGLNDLQEVVGGVDEGVAYAWSWSSAHGLRLLDNLIDPLLTINIASAIDVNNVGQIITYGLDYSDNVAPFRIMLLTPIDSTINGDLDGDGVVGILDFLSLLGSWGQCPNLPEPCPSDLDGDSVVGIADLLILLGNWT